ncbi:hypothetical protein J6590_094118 [Homalodisca vitripennis]|nr:hypothetical protein J6590_094118 [Homalodisca vitripennis]
MDGKPLTKTLDEFSPLPTTGGGLLLRVAAHKLASAQISLRAFYLQLPKHTATALCILCKTLISIFGILI